MYPRGILYLTTCLLLSTGILLLGRSWIEITRVEEDRLVGVSSPNPTLKYPPDYVEFLGARPSHVPPNNKGREIYPPTKSISPHSLRILHWISVMIVGMGIIYIALGLSVYWGLQKISKLRRKIFKNSMTV
jgi:hypothetical protein